MNREIIAVDQDKLGKAGRRVQKWEDTEVWLKPLANGEYALALFNRGPAEATVKAELAPLEMAGTWRVRDLWRHKDLPVAAGKFSASVEPHGVVAVRFSRPAR
jgi:alpha-galactosidase